MKTTKQQLLQEFREKFTDVALLIDIIGEKDFMSMVSSFLSDCIDKVEKQTAEQIEKEMKPAIDDFAAAGQALINRGYRNSGTEVLENVGYIKGIFYKLKSQKGDR